MAAKMLTYAIGRHLVFEDQAELNRIASELRQRGDGLRDLVELIVTSEPFTK